MEKTIETILKEALVGKKVKHKNQYNRDVILQVEDVTIKKNHRQITPDTRENDWWGESVDWETIKIHFVDGSSVECRLFTRIEIVE